MSVSTRPITNPEFASSTDWDDVEMLQSVAHPKSGVWAYLWPVAAGFLIRLAVVLTGLGGTEPHNDAADYFSEATKLYQGTREAIPFYWPPGTSYYLEGWFTLFGASFTVAQMAMVVLSSAQIAIVGLLTRQANISHRVAVSGCWLWAVYPPAVLLVCQPYSQHLAALALAAIGLCGIHWLKSRSYVWVVLMGLSVGGGCLARPSMMSVALLCALVVFFVSALQSGRWTKRALTVCTQCLLLVVSIGVMVAPSILHNARTGGGYTLSINNERNFFLGNNPYTPWYKTSHFAQRSLDELSPEVRDYLLSNYSAPDRRKAMTTAAMDHIRANPGLTALRTINRARSFWGFDYLASRVALARTGSKLASAVVLLTEAVGYCAVMMLALVAMIYWKGHVQGMTLVWHLAVIAAYTGPYCLAFSSGTYHFPVIGLIVPLAAIGLHLIWNKGWKQILSSSAVGVVFVFFIAMQIEYAYFTLAAGISRSPETSQVTKASAANE